MFMHIKYNDYESSFEDLLVKDNSSTIHHRNIRLLAVEIFKIKNNISTQLVSEILEKRNISYNLRSQTEFVIENVNTVNFGKNSINILGPKIWNIIPDNIKNSKDINQFKKRVKTWMPVNCPCQICSNYVQHVGYIGVS